MIRANDIGHAERILSIFVQEDDVAPQFEHCMVDRDAFENFLKDRTTLMKKRYPNMDPRIEPMLNTMLMHFFFVGVLCGRGVQAL
jgi:hypothetical protein